MAVVPSPRSLILNLLLAARTRGGGELGVPEILAASAVFGLPENSVRVALARGVAAELLVAPHRGRYALGPEAEALAAEVGRWREAARSVVSWSGDWIGVHVGASGRSDRPALRARERALSLLGMAELERGLHVRPDNLSGGVGAMRMRLQGLVPKGCDVGTVFRLDGFSRADQERACALWDGEDLGASYRDVTAQLDSWLEDAARLPLDRAAREAFVLGNDAIRRVVFDPLLPAPLVDIRARDRFIATVVRFDAAGQATWRRFLAEARRSASGSSNRRLPSARRRTR